MSSHVLEIAKEIANRQGRLAMSPAELDDDGSIVLCAGSCIAKAAILASGDLESLADFEARVIHEEKYAYLGGLFRRHGVELDAAEYIQENDNRPPEHRLEWFNRI